MQLKRTGPETVEITTRDGSVILFSYGEPVAVAPGGNDHVIVTERFISRSTSAHIVAFKAGRPGVIVTHDAILTITKEAC